MKRLTVAQYRALPPAQQWDVWRSFAHRRRVLDTRPPTVADDQLRSIVERVMAEKRRT